MCQLYFAKKMPYKNKIEKFYFECAVCEGKSFLKIYGVSVFNVCLCERCGLVCLNPRMDERGYMETFYQNYRRDLFGSYLAEPVSQDELQKRAMESPFPRKVLDDLKPYLLKESKILEVGSGAGEALIFLKENGFSNVAGVEPVLEDCQRLEKLYGIECHAQSFSEFASTNDKNGKFDCVILKHVIEHFVEPGRALQAINGLMAGKGILYIMTPDLYRFKNPFSQFCIPHTFYFSPATLEALLLKYGFKLKGYRKNLIPHEMVLLAEKSSSVPEIHYDPGEPEKVLAHLRKNKFRFIFFKSVRFAEAAFMKVFGEYAYLKTRMFLKNLVVAVIKRLKQK